MGSKRPRIDLRSDAGLDRRSTPRSMAPGARASLDLNSPSGTSRRGVDRWLGDRDELLAPFDEPLVLCPSHPRSRLAHHELQMLAGRYRSRSASEEWRV